MERAQTYNTLWDLGPSFQSLPALKVRIFKFQQNGNNFYFLVNTLFHEIKVFLNCTSKSCIKIVHQNTGLVSNRASVTSWGKGASLALVGYPSHNVRPPSLLSPFCWEFEPPTKFSKRGAWQDLNFERGVAGKEGVTFFKGYCHFYQKI